MHSVDSSDLRLVHLSVQMVVRLRRIFFFLDDDGNDEKRIEREGRVRESAEGKKRPIELKRGSPLSLFFLSFDENKKRKQTSFAYRVGVFSLIS